MVTILSIILISVLPLFYLNSNFNPYEFPKFFLFLLGSLLISQVSIIKIIKKNDISNPLKNYAVITVLIFWMINLISDLIGFDPKTSLLGSQFRHQGFITLTSGVLLFFSLSIFNKERVSKKWFLLLPLSLFIISSIATIQGIKFNFLEDYSIPNYNNRIVGTFGNPNFLGGYIVVLMTYIFLEKSIMGKINIYLKLLLFLTCISSLFFSGSRGSFVSLFSVLLILFLYLFLKLPINKILKKTVLLLSFIFVIIFIALIQDQLSLRISYWENRNFIWKNAIEAISKKPLFGYGQENFEISLPYQRMIRVDNTHNIFLEILVSSGTVGLFSFIIFIFLILRKSDLAIKLSIIAFLIRSQFNPLSIPEIALFWFLAGLSQNQSLKFSKKL